MKPEQFTTTLIPDDKTSACWIELPFDPKKVFGKVRAPVKVTINKHTFRTTIFSMQGHVGFPVNRENRESAGINAGDKIVVTIDAPCAGGLE